MHLCLLPDLIPIGTASGGQARAHRISPWGKKKKKRKKYSTPIVLTRNPLITLPNTCDTSCFTIAKETKTKRTTRQLETCFRTEG